MSAGSATTKMSGLDFQLNTFRRAVSRRVHIAVPDMEFDEVILLPHCLSVIRTESRKAPRIETGGPLVGYIAEKGALIVTDAAGPGPRAKLERYSVTIDGRHAQKFCDKCHAGSDGRIDYVGDWHKHPGLSLRPSTHDVSAIKTMAEFEHSPTKHPISLIYRSWPRSWQVYVWDGSGSLIKIRSKASAKTVS
jgi:integrative and conjugative element protein (TIGR02256 family)